jgi:hypothetical protein
MIITKDGELFPGLQMASKLKVAELGPALALIFHKAFKN